MLNRPPKPVLCALVCALSLFLVACGDESGSSDDHVVDDLSDIVGDMDGDATSDMDDTSDVSDAGDTSDATDTSDVTDTGDAADADDASDSTTDMVDGDTADTDDATDMAGCTQGTPLMPQCISSSPPAQTTICFENASGCPGDTVEVDVFINAPTGCDTLVQATASFGNQGFVIANVADDSMPSMGRCIRREVCDICNPTLMDWAILPGNAVGQMACPDNYPIPAAGMPIDTIEVDIPVDATPGDYVLNMQPNGNAIAVEAACGGMDIGGLYESRELVTPTIRVY